MRNTEILLHHIFSGELCAHHIEPLNLDRNLFLVCHRLCTNRNPTAFTNSFYSRTLWLTCDSNKCAWWSATYAFAMQSKSQTMYMPHIRNKINNKYNMGLGTPPNDYSSSLNLIRRWENILYSITKIYEYTENFSSPAVPHHFIGLNAHCESGYTTHYIVYRASVRVNRNPFESNVNDERTRTGEAARTRTHKIRNRTKITNLISGT